MTTILHLNNEQGWRGGERQTLLLAAGLKERGLDSRIGCSPGGALHEAAQAAGVATVPIPANNVPAFVALIRAARRVDLVHCHTGRGHSLTALASGFHGTPFVVTRRVDFVPRQSRFNRFKFRRAARVVCISRFIAEQLHDWGVSRDRLEVIRSAVPLPDPEATSPGQRMKLRKALGVPEGIPLVGNIAALVGHKDHATLLRAARRVIEQHREARFVILGEGGLRAELLGLHRELGLGDRVQFLGFLPDAERYLPAFDVFALSSSMEGLGSIILDAFAARVPVAATAGGAIPELVRQGETGLLSNVGDDASLAGGIVRLLEEKDLVAELTRKARELVTREFSVAAMVEAYVGVYRAVLGERFAGAVD